LIPAQARAVTRSAVRLPLTRAVARIASVLPQGQTLPERAWRRRHHALLAILWLHVFGLPVFALFRGYGVAHSLLHGVSLALLAGLATVLSSHRRAAASLVSLGLISSSALLVHSWGGVIEGHFHFFVMIALLALYEDWLPFLLAAAYVVIHHGVAGAIDPHAVYNHPDAVAHPWKWALIHGGFVVAAGAASVATWRLNEDVRLAMRSSQEQLREAQRMARIGSWQWDVRSNEVTWSEELFAIMGVDPQNWTPTYEGFLEYLHSDDRERIEKTIRESLETGRRFQYEARIITPDGRERVIDVTGDVAHDGRGSVKMVGTAQDITDRKKIEQELSLREEAEREYRARSDFLSRVSHELRTPLNAILGFSQLMELEELTAEQRRHIEQITKGGRHLLELINEVLEISRIESGNMNVSLEPVPVQDVVDEVLQLLEPLANRRSITLESRLPAGKRFVEADKQRLKQVLLNLVSNGIKYNRDGGSVRIRLEETCPGKTFLLVTDSGKGIAEDKLAKVFHPFERLDVDQARIEGTGLGLTLSKLLVEAMGGSLAVESQPWVGTTFIVQLGASVAPETDTVVLDSISEPPSGNGKPGRSFSVLYVEDNISNFELVEQVLLRRPEVSLLAAMNGNLGFELAKEHRPDLILVDLHLPGMSGEELLERLKADPATSTIPVVVISADATESQIERLRSAGACDYLTKPIELTSFLELVDRTIETTLVA
jgi:PAS domain S-box-containing protein